MTVSNTAPAAASKKAVKKATAKKTALAKKAATKPDPSQTAFQVLTGQVGHAKLKDLSVNEQALLVEVLLEQSRSHFFDDNRQYTGPDFKVIVAELLGIGMARATTVLRTMKRRQAYSTKGAGRGVKYTFAGTDEARSILAEIGVASSAAEPVKPVVNAVPEHIQLGMTATPPIKLDHGFGKAPNDQDDMLPPLDPPGTIRVIMHGVPGLEGAEAALVRLVTDQVVGYLNGDPDLVANVICELAARYRFRV